MSIFRGRAGPACSPVSPGLDSDRHWNLCCDPYSACCSSPRSRKPPCRKSPGAFRDRRFIGTALAGSFLPIPLIVLGFVTLLPGHDAIRLGVALVLMVPCTDWFITFTRLGRCDAERAIAF